MKEQDLLVAPPRLIHAEDEVGRALRARQEMWDAQQRRAQPSNAQFAALRAKHEQRVLARSRWTRGAAAVAILGLTSLGHFLLPPAGRQALLVAPDRMRVSAPASQDTLQPAESGRTRPLLAVPTPPENAAGPSAHAGPSDAPPQRPMPPAHAVNPTAERSTIGSRSTRPTAAGPHPTRGTEAAAAAARDVHPTLPASSRRGQDCKTLDYVEARACYTQKTEGRGITAELAYLERARLEQKEGGDAAAALRSLNEYQQRFPQGTLQPEATLARIRLLVSTHQNPEARAAISQALPRMPEKAAQLREVALDLAVAAGDCTQAAQLLKQIPAEVATPNWRAAHLGRCSPMTP